MVDITKDKCKSELCDTIISNTKYKGYCFRCFIYTFPNNQIVKNYKVKERHIMDFLDLHFKNYIECYDITIKNGCSKRRPDCLIKRNDYNIIIECDENQHKYGNYSCDNKRTMELFNDLGNSPLVIIRFNPDNYKNKENQRTYSSFKYHKLTGVPYIRNKEEWNNRLTKLKEIIEYYIENIPKKEIEEIKLFYDEL